MRGRSGWVIVVALACACLPVFAQHGGGCGGGGGGGHQGGGGCGDVFGELVHLLRDAETGQPILQRRWIEMPKELPGYGWGYCPVPVDKDDLELGFEALSCDVAAADADRVVEVDYFGRLNGGRTKERNNRMHFNEVISTIASDEVGLVNTDETGRLKLGFDCSENPAGRIKCKEWSVVDSPMESMGLFTRLMKYGHLQTDPGEEDPWAHGDPAKGAQYHPALDYDDWSKFHRSLRHLLPMLGDTDACFPQLGEGGERVFNPACAEGEELRAEDFVRAAIFLGGAANKTGRGSVDLVQFFDRIVKVPKDTAHTSAPVRTLPALVRSCPSTPENPDPEAPVPEVIVYDMEACEIFEAHDGLENYEHFTDVQERFVDFGRAEYERADWRRERLLVIRPEDVNGVVLDPQRPRWWYEDEDVWLLAWLDHANGPDPGKLHDIEAFVSALEDTIRAIQFVHNYAVPVDLGWDFEE